MRRLLLLPLLAPTMLWAAGATNAAAAPEMVGTGKIFQVFFVLLLVVVLIIASAWAMRRFSTMPFGRGGVLRLLASVMVGQRERIVLVQAGEVQLLIGVAPGQVRTLHVFDKPVLLDTAEGRGAERFAERLGDALKGRVKEERE